MTSQLDHDVAARQAAARFSTSPIDITPVLGGLINVTYMVTERSGDFILQRIAPEVFPDPHGVMANIVAVSDCPGPPTARSGRSDDLVIPRLRPTTDGRWWVDVAGATWRAWETVRGAAPVDAVTVDRAASGARLLARAHRRLARCDPERLVVTIEHFHDPLHRLESLETIVADDPVGRAAAAGAEIDAVRAHLDLAGDAEHLVNAPAEVAHNDTKLANFLFRDDTAVCLIDLDTLMPTARVWDVADLIRSAGTRALEDDPDPSRHVADPELIDAILDGYGTQGPTRAEIATATVCLVWEQSMRFLGDWIAGDVYFRTTRPHQNLDRARGQLAMLESLRTRFGR